MKNWKNNLDEMQESEALKIAERSFWVMEWGLVAAILIQTLLYEQGNFKYVAGEFVVLCVGSCYSIVANLRKGIWDRHLKATPKSNLLVSLCASAGFSLIFGIINYVQYGMAEMALLSAGIFFIFVFVLCFVVLTVLSAAYKKRKEKLEREEDE